MQLAFHWDLAINCHVLGILFIWKALYLEYGYWSEKCLTTGNAND